MIVRIERAWRILKTEGPFVLSRHLIAKMRNLARPAPAGPVSASQGEDYQAWLRRVEPGSQELAQQSREAASFAYQPTLSILTPLYRPDPPLLKEMVASLQAQTYPSWELWLAGALPDEHEAAQLIESLAAADDRVHFQPLASNTGIAANTNAALEMAAGEFVAFLDQDDTLAPQALFAVVQRLNQDPDLDLIYSDHDLLSQDGSRRYNPLLKPNWSPEILLSANYITHLTVVRTALMRQVGGLNLEMDGAQDWDLFLRLVEQTQRVAHIPQILYHWRDSQGSTAEDIWAKPYAPPAQLRAISQHLERLGLPEPAAFFDKSGYIRVRWDTDPTKKVSIIIPSRGASEMLANCVDSILDKTAYANFEILIVNNGERRPESFPYYERVSADPRVRVLHYDQPFNYSSVNNFGAGAAQGDFLLFLNDDVQVIAGDWLDELVMWAGREEVGAVGAKLLSPDGSIQHAGAIIGLTGFGGHIFAGRPENQWSIFGLAEWYRDYLAVTAACVIFRREVFERIGGFDERFLLCGNDVEICLRVWEHGMRVVYNPFARLTHLEGATRHGEVPFEDFHTSYPHYLPALRSGDPFFNPNLSYWHLDPQLVQPGEPQPLQFVQDFLQKQKGSA